MKTSKATGIHPATKLEARGFGRHVHSEYVCPCGFKSRDLAQARKHFARRYATESLNCPLTKRGPDRMDALKNSLKRI